MCGCCFEGRGSSEDKAILSNPTKNRGCTDILSLLIFFAFWAGMIFIASFAISEGDAFRLIYGYDSFGNTCDEDNTGRQLFNLSNSGLNMKGKPYVFFMESLLPSQSMAICVNKCPDSQLNDMIEVHHFFVRSGSYLCRYDIEASLYHQTPTGIKGPCPVTPVKHSKPLLNRCVPTDLTLLNKKNKDDIIGFLNESDVFQKTLSDLCNSWKEMIGLCFVALGFAFAMVLLIRFLASIIVWLILAVVVLACIIGTAFLWWTYASFKNKLDSDTTVGIPLLTVEIDSEKAFLCFAIIATVLTLIVLVIVLVMRKRIRLVVTLFHEAGQCVAAMPCLLVQPFFTFFILIIFFIYWVIVLAYLSTAEKPHLDSHGFVKYKEHETVSYFWWYHLIGLFWTSEFILACEELVISGAVATWYFTRDKEQVDCPICSSVCRLVVYHLGSVALGSLVITLVKLPRMILMYISKKMKNSESSCAQYCTKCCICCLYCLEKCLKYINANAYTVIAVSGKNFCSSARQGFNILVSNALRVAALNSIGDFVLFLGKLGVMASTAAVGIIWLRQRPDLHYYAIPILLACVFAYFIASTFLSVYEMVIDALLLCFCEDCDMNDGSPERPYFASKALLAYVQDSSTALNELTKKSGEGEAEPAKL